jgi:hypothetical protein
METTLPAANHEWLIVGTEMFPVEGSLKETVNKHSRKLRKTLGCFSTVTAGNQPPHLEVARAFKERYGRKIPTLDWAYEAIEDIAREQGVQYYDGRNSAAFVDTVYPLIKPR